MVTVRAAIEAGASAKGYTTVYARGCNIDDGNLTMIPAAVAVGTLQVNPSARELSL